MYFNQPQLPWFKEKGRIIAYEQITGNYSYIILNNLRNFLKVKIKM